MRTSDKTLISVITVVYNAVNTLERTILSVLGQKSEQVEYLIIDGASTDGSREIIERYKDDISGFISEPDNGIYDAMNKGISLSTGKWLYFLGADDVLCANVLSQIVDELDTSAVLVFGKVAFDSGGTMTSFLGTRTLMQNTVHHQSAFYKRSLFENFRYDLNYRAISDYELNLKVMLEKKPVKQVDMVIAECSSSGTSSDFDVSLRETNSVRSKLIKNRVVQSVLTFVLGAYYLQKKIRGAGLAP